MSALCQKRTLIDGAEVAAAHLARSGVPVIVFGRRANAFRRIESAYALDVLASACRPRSVMK
jgi:hypothetical protein